ncbi:MAG: fumarylacetoacetate hydrolase family protein [Hyphomicrobiaceae bacterium]
MAHWVRFEKDGEAGFGTLDAEVITVHRGDMFSGATATGGRVSLGEVRLLTPCVPSKMICLWNNFRALAAKLAAPIPTAPLYLLKPTTSFIGSGEAVRRPPSYSGKIVFEGELGIVIGERLSDANEAEAATGIFGYTCVNDITAADIINADPSFPQWARAKGFDTFGAFGPAIATGLDVAGASIRTVLNGTERQNYPVADMIFPPARLVSLLSADMTLLPGDVIACGTSVGVGVMKEPGNVVEVSIDGIGTLSNTLA